jgi:hypothetical protein
MVMTAAMTERPEALHSRVVRRLGSFEQAPVGSRQNLDTHSAPTEWDRMGSRSAARIVAIWVGMTALAIALVPGAAHAISMSTVKQSCAHVRGSISIIPGLGASATDQTIELRSHKFGCNEAGRSGALIAAFRAPSLSCSTLKTVAASGRAVVTWDNGRVSNALVALRSSPGDVRDVTLAGRVLDGNRLVGMAVDSTLRLEGAGGGTIRCSGSRLLTHVTFTFIKPLQFGTVRTSASTTTTATTTAPPVVSRAVLAGPTPPPPTAPPTLGFSAPESLDGANLAPDPPRATGLVWTAWFALGVVALLGFVMAYRRRQQVAQPTRSFHVTAPRRT